MDCREAALPAFSPAELADLLAFLSGATEPLLGGDAPMPADPVAGRDLFQSKGWARASTLTDSHQLN